MNTETEKDVAKIMETIATDENIIKRVLTHANRLDEEAETTERDLNYTINIYHEEKKLDVITEDFWKGLSADIEEMIVDRIKERLSQLHESGMKEKWIEVNGDFYAERDRELD